MVYQKNKTKKKRNKDQKAFNCSGELFGFYIIFFCVCFVCKVVHSACTKKKLLCKRCFFSLFPSPHSIYSMLFNLNFLFSKYFMIYFVVYKSQQKKNNPFRKWNRRILSASLKVKYYGSAAFLFIRKIPNAHTHKHTIFAWNPILMKRQQKRDRRFLPIFFIKSHLIHTFK